MDYTADLVEKSGLTPSFHSSMSIPDSIGEAYHDLFQELLP